jgi:hypothetical protein
MAEEAPAEVIKHLRALLGRKAVVPGVTVR